MRKVLLVLAVIAVVALLAVPVLAQDGSGDPVKPPVTVTMVVQGLVSAAMIMSRALVKWKHENPKSSFKSGEFWIWLGTMISTSFQGYVGQ